MSGPREHIRRRLELLGTRIDAISWSALVGRIEKWSMQNDARYVCLCGPQSLARGHRNADYLEAVAAADTVAPDGVIVAWLMRRRGVILQEHIDGATLLWRCAERASSAGVPVYLWGGTSSVLQRVVERLRHNFPGLRLVGYASADGDIDEETIAQRIVDSGAKLVFVGPGPNNRAIWMSRVSPKVSGVMVDTGYGFLRIAAGPTHESARVLQFPRRPSPLRVRQRLAEAQHKTLTGILFLYYLIRDQLELHSPRLKTQ